MTTASYPEALLLLSILTSGLMAGLFFAWSVSVTPGVGRLADLEYIKAFKAMNRAILNFTFYTVFFGCLVLLPATAVVFHLRSPGVEFYLITAAAVLYVAGVFGVTVFGNVPLNNALDGFREDLSTPEGLEQTRDEFEKRWNRLNMVRTLAASVTLILLAIAAIVY